MKKYIGLMKYTLLFTSVTLLTLGIFNNEPMIVLKKAINICLECIGIG